MGITTWLCCLRVTITSSHTNTWENIFCMYVYHMLQIVRGGKVLQLQDSTVICSKTFAVGPSWATNFQTLIAPTQKVGFAKQWSWNNQSTTESTILFILSHMTLRVTSHVYWHLTTSVVDGFETSSFVQGYHVYQDTWTPVIGEQLVCRREDSNPRNRYTSFCNLLSEGNYFTGKVSRLITNPWKPWNFSTSNNLQYTIY